MEQALVSDAHHSSCRTIQCVGSESSEVIDLPEKSENEKPARDSDRAGQIMFVEHSELTSGSETRPTKVRSPVRFKYHAPALNERGYAHDTVTLHQ